MEFFLEAVDLILQFLNHAFGTNLLLLCYFSGRIVFFFDSLNLCLIPVISIISMLILLFLL